MKPSDAELVAAYQAGDEGAFDAIYRRYAPRLTVYIWRRCGSWHLAEDLVQEAMLQAARYMPHGTIHSLNGYLILCVRQWWWLRAAQARRRPEEWPFDPYHAYQGQIGFVEDRVLERETIGEIVQLLASLSEEERAVAVLKVLYDYDMASAGAHLGRSKSSAAALWRRCTRKFAGWAGTRSGYAALEQALILARYPDQAPLADQCRVSGCSRPRHAHERCQYHAENMLARRRQLATQRQGRTHV